MTHHLHMADGGPDRGLFIKLMSPSLKRWKHIATAEWYILSRLSTSQIYLVAKCSKLKEYVCIVKVIVNSYNALGVIIRNLLFFE